MNPEGFGLEVQVRLVVSNMQEVVSQIQKSIKNVVVKLQAESSGFGAGVREGLTGTKQEGKATGLLGLAVGKLAFAGVVLTAIREGMTAISGVLKDASPALRGTFVMFGQAMMVFFKPFGDFLATLLRPMALWLLKMAVKFIGWLDKMGPSQRAGLLGGGLAGAVGGFAVGGPVGAIVGAIGAGAIASAVGSIADKYNGGISGSGSKMQEDLNKQASALAKSVGDTAKTVGVSLEGIGSWILSSLKGALAWEWDAIKGFGKWIWGGITGGLADAWALLKGFGSWLWTQITGIWDWASTGINNVAAWLWGEIKSIWDWASTGVENVAKWLWGEINKIWDWTKTGVTTISQWLWDQIQKIWDWGATGITNVATWLWTEIKAGLGVLTSIGQDIYDWIMSALRTAAQNLGLPGYQSGTLFVENTGLALLHRGEQVSRPGRSEGKATELHITMQNTFTGPINSGVDVEASINRGFRQAETYFRARGLI